LRIDRAQVITYQLIQGGIQETIVDQCLDRTPIEYIPLHQPNTLLYPPRSVQATLDSHDLLLRLIRSQVFGDHPDMDPVLSNSVFLDSFQDGSMESGLVSPSVVITALCVVVASR
jgi:hypothetical protein